MTIHRRPTPTISTNQTTHGHQNRLVVFLISDTFLYKHTKYTTEGWKKRRTNNRVWVSSKLKKGEVSDTFVQPSVHLQAITSVYLRETATKPLGMLTHLLALVNPASVGQQVLAAAVLTPVDWSYLLTDLLCRLVSAAPFC